MAENDPTYRLTKDGKVYRRGYRKYANLDVYEGEFLDGAKHGKGQLRVFCGDLYVGEFEYNFFHGSGSYVWTGFFDDSGAYVAGKKYDGEWRVGKFHGRGVYTLGTGDVYSGEFERGLYHGQGTLRLRSGDTFVGGFTRGKPGGFMKAEFPGTGSHYEGEMRMGKFHGKGKYVYGGGKGFYDGEWARGKAHGSGIRVYSNGSRYVGSFLDGEAHGEGVMFYSNGDQYIGSFSRGALFGRGVMKYARGDMYEGNFLSGVFYGEGKYTYSDGSYYDGQYKAVKLNKATMMEIAVADGKRHGFGLRVFANGSRYKGTWANDKMDGEGELVQADGGKFDGFFCNGLKQGEGTEKFGNELNLSYICPMGHRHKGIGFCQYVGAYAKGAFHGQGVYRCQDGREYRGAFKDGMRDGYGRQEYLRDGDRGDLGRLCIGGRHSLYRLDLYEGSWREGVRQGPGVATFVNGDCISGHFESGQLHGYAEYTFNKGKRQPGKKKERRRMVEYARGRRVRWMPTAAQAAKEASSFLLKLRAQIANEDQGAASGGERSRSSSPYRASASGSRAAASGGGGGSGEGKGYERGRSPVRAKSLVAKGQEGSQGGGGKGRSRASFAV